MINSDLAPIVVFVYARPDHTKNTIEALSRNEYAKESNIYIYSDNSKKDSIIDNVNEVRKYIRGIEKNGWFKSVTIVESKKNKGLANSIIEGVTEIIKKHNKVIVVEDDLITSKYFIRYMNEALNFYKEDSNIWSISGYNLPIEIPKDYDKDIYLSYRGCSWGWATWKNRWETVDWNVNDYKKFIHNPKKIRLFNRGGPDMTMMLKDQMNGYIDSWAIRWCYEQFKQEKYTIYPTNSLVSNQGLDGSGTHSGINSNFDVKLNDYLPRLKKISNFNPIITRNFYKHFNYGIKQKIKNIIYFFHIEGLFNLLRKKKIEKL